MKNAVAITLATKTCRHVRRVFILRKRAAAAPPAGPAGDIVHARTNQKAPRLRNHAHTLPPKRDLSDLSASSAAGLGLIPNRCFTARHRASTHGMKSGTCNTTPANNMLMAKNTRYAIGPRARAAMAVL